MILSTEQIRERIEWLREQSLFIQATKPEERAEREREWLQWAERRVHALLKEATTL